jgi:hypothetical protein
MGVCVKAEWLKAIGEPVLDQPFHHQATDQVDDAQRPAEWVENIVVLRRLANCAPDSSKR